MVAHPFLPLADELCAALGKDFQVHVNWSTSSLRNGENVLFTVYFGNPYASPDRAPIVVQFSAYRMTTEDLLAKVDREAREWLALGRSLPSVWFSGEEARAA